MKEFRERDSLSSFQTSQLCYMLLSGKGDERVGEKCRLRCVSYMSGGLFGACGLLTFFISAVISWACPVFPQPHRVEEPILNYTLVTDTSVSRYFKPIAIQLTTYIRFQPKAIKLKDSLFLVTSCCTTLSSYALKSKV